MRLKALQGSKVSLAELMVSAAVKRWLAIYIETSRNEKGRVLAKVRAGAHIVPGLGHYRLSRLTAEHLRTYRLHLEGKGLATMTVLHLLSDARCFLRWCEDAGLVDRSPFPRRLFTRTQERPPDRLSTKTANTIRKLPEPYGFVCRLALGTGLRWGELVRAQSTDVERGFLVISQTKSGKVRRVPLDPELLKEIRGRVGKLVPFGEKSPGSFARVIRSASGIAGFHAHQLRYTFACEWLEDGGSLAAQQQVLGHASIVTTQRYARLTDEIVMEERLRMRRKADQMADQQFVGWCGPVAQTDRAAVS
jgi:integrase